MAKRVLLEGFIFISIIGADWLLEFEPVMSGKQRCQKLTQPGVESLIG
jgi:hypothetical protein